MQTGSVEITPFVLVAALGRGCGGHANPAAPSAPASQPAAAPAPPPSVQTITIGGSGQATALPVGQAVQLKATAQMADGSSADVSALATWSSDNTSVATVSAS